MSWYEFFHRGRMVVYVKVPMTEDELESISEPIQDSCDTLAAHHERAFDSDCILLELPVKMAVCGTCDGKGSHVNPAIDGNGITASEFAEDPEFAKDYFGGIFDVVCYDCGGNNVVPDINRDENVYTEEHAKSEARFDEHMEDEAAFAAEQAAERRMGA